MQKQAREEVMAQALYRLLQKSASVPAPVTKKPAVQKTASLRKLAYSGLERFAYGKSMQKKAEEPVSEGRKLFPTNGRPNPNPNPRLHPVVQGQFAGWHPEAAQAYPLAVQRQQEPIIPSVGSMAGAAADLVTSPVETLSEAEVVDDRAQLQQQQQQNMREMSRSLTERAVTDPQGARAISSQTGIPHTPYKIEVRKRATDDPAESNVATAYATGPSPAAPVPQNTPQRKSLLGRAGSLVGGVVGGAARLAASPIAGAAIVANGVAGKAGVPITNPVRRGSIATAEAIGGKGHPLNTSTYGKKPYAPKPGTVPTSQQHQDTSGWL